MWRPRSVGDRMKKNGIARSCPSSGCCLASKERSPNRQIGQSLARHEGENERELPLARKTGLATAPGGFARVWEFTAARRSASRPSALPGRVRARARRARKPDSSSARTRIATVSAGSKSLRAHDRQGERRVGADVAGLVQTIVPPAASDRRERAYRSGVITKNVQDSARRSRVRGRERDDLARGQERETRQRDQRSGVCQERHGDRQDRGRRVHPRSISITRSRARPPSPNGDPSRAPRRSIWPPPEPESVVPLRRPCIESRPPAMDAIPGPPPDRAPCSTLSGRTGRAPHRCSRARRAWGARGARNSAVGWCRPSSSRAARAADSPGDPASLNPHREL
jgi:hypothetical protein